MLEFVTTELRYNDMFAYPIKSDGWKLDIFTNGIATN